MNNFLFSHKDKVFCCRYVKCPVFQGEGQTVSYLIKNITDSIWRASIRHKTVETHPIQHFDKKIFFHHHTFKAEKTSLESKREYQLIQIKKMQTHLDASAADNF